MGVPNFEPGPVLIRAGAGGRLPSYFPTPAQTARSSMYIRYDLFVASAVAFTLCLAAPAEAAQKQRPKSQTVTAYSNN